MSDREQLVLQAKDICVDYKQGGPIWRRKSYFRAIDRVSFDVAKGDAIGVIGRNGAGKTTLLKVLAGIILPNYGVLRRFTKSITLLALGAGYEPAVAAQDNVILSGMLLGVPRHEMESKLDSIFEYAELRDFRKMPVKHYSSGMKSRLAFATIVHVETDVLLIDEVFAVGDRDFHAKSDETMTSRINAGQTMILVSHQISSVKRLCRSVMWFEHGKLVAKGDVDTVVAQYERSSASAKLERDDNAK